MSWLQLKLAVPGTFADELSDFCLQLGALSVVLDNAGADTPANAVLEPAPGATIFWKRAAITAIWSADADLGTISSSLSAFLHDKGIFGEIDVIFMDNSDLPASLPQPVANLEFAGGRLWLLPREASDDRIKALGGAPHIKLDPGLAFGSGLHPTTQLCLDYLARMDSLVDARMLDFGCGSGVLALAGAGGYPR